MTTHTTVPLTSHRKRLILLMSCGLLIISAIVIQQVIAQDSKTGTLKPPFHLIRSDQLGPSNGVPPLPLDAPIIMTQTFDSSYAPLYTINGFGWHQVSFSGIVDTYTWGRVAGLAIPNPVLPITDTVWNAGTNPPGSTPLTPGTPYTNNQQSLLVYGPLDLSDYSSLLLTATYHSDVQPGDFFGAAVSTDGANFTAVSSESSRDPSLAIERTGYYNLAAYTRQPQVWIAFYFTSNNDDIVALGTYIDEVVLRGEPLHKVRLPYVMLQIPSPTPTPTNTPTPTATPTQVSTIIDNYTFGDGSSTNADFQAWSGQYSYSCGDSCTVTQNPSPNGNPGGAIAYSVGGTGVLVGTSPNHTIPTNFELSADIMVIEGKVDARFGLIFDASSSTFYVDSSDGHIKLDPVFNFYKFDLNIDPNDETLIDDVRLQRWTGGGATNLVGRTQLPAQYQRRTGQWNNIRIIRQNDTITVYVNGYPIIVNYSDSTYIGTKKYGVFLQPQTANNNSNPLKIRFDNVIVTQLP